jgi:transcriptional regulator with XRE-family HTH domain
VIELVRPLEADRDDAPLVRARVARQLTLEEAAKRAGLPVERVEWLEEGRVYRFATADEALTTLLVYASSLGIEHREARELAGLPVPSKPFEQSNRVRLLGLVALAAAAAAFAAFLSLPGPGDGSERAAFQEQVAAKLPPAWKIKVEVLNGGGDINWTRQVASKIGALAYTIDRVGRADRFDYQETAVYFEPGGRDLAVRLARELGVKTRPLPGGSDPRHLLVIVGPQRGPGL